MATEFLAENNVCGQTILQIVAEGNTIICELLRLKDYVPELFYLTTKEEQQKYGEIIKDFGYFQIADAQEAKIESDEKLRLIDEELRENYIVTLNRFYIVFESIHKYVKDLNTFIEELNAGLFIQQSMEKVFQDAEGKQLMCEALYLYGMMLLVTDLHIPGIVRERILVSYNRYSALKTHSDSSIDEVCKLLRSTGFNDGPAGSSGGGASRKVTNYPEDFFARVPISPLYIEMVIGRLRSDDVYNQIAVYPLPEQHSTALANQAGMLYVCLYFSTKTLHTQPARMREIVDKFFSNNWIVSLYMGITVNLINAWESFKAAKTALTNTLDNANLKEICHRQKQSMETLLNRTRNILREGNLTEQNLLDHMPKVMALVRDCNITVRWVMLHTSSVSTLDNVSQAVAASKRCRQVRELIEQELDFRGVVFFELLLNTSQLELKVREMLKRLLEERDDRWTDYRREATDRMQDLADAFSGARPFVKMRPNESLSRCFANIRKEIDGLSREEQQLSQTGRTIIQLLQALEEVQDFHGLSRNMQVKQHIVETRQYLHEMFHTISIKENDLINLQLIGDFSYAWRLIDGYTGMMQENIRHQPRLVIKLRSTFLKLASALEIPLLRLNQAESEHLIDVSRYYSNELANFVRKVVQIIPETMFTLLAQIVDLQTNVLKELPARLEKERMKEYAQFEERFQIAKLTYTLSTFTEGILAMQTTLVGVVELDSRKLLEDGIRRKLVQNVAEAFHQQLVFSQKVKESELYPRLETLHRIIHGYRRSFEYVQDYLNIHCMRIWNEEMARIIRFNVEKECQPFLKSKSHTEWDQSSGGSLDGDTVDGGLVPIPIYQPVDMTSINFMGRLGREILRITDPKTTIYIDICSSWYDYKTHKLLLTNKFASKINETFGPAGLIGLDRLYGALLKSELETLLATVQRKVQHEGNWSDVLAGIKTDLERADIVENSAKSYAGFISSVSRFFSTSSVGDWLLKVGQKQTLRGQIALELNCSCKIRATKLEASLRTLNEAILLDFQRHQLDESAPIPRADLVAELNTYLLYAGLYDPYRKVYIKQDVPPRFLPLLLFLFLVSTLPKLQYMENVDSLVAKKKNESIDGHPLTIGLLTVLRQFDAMETDIFLQYLCQYVLSFVQGNLEAKTAVGTEALFALRFLEIFTGVADIPRSYLEHYLSEVILDQYVFLAEVK
uniref:WASH complex subunit 5 n=1 Tax=Anopheles christyi TaxID=43041 RepID=A0A182JXG8_9DIPT